MPWGSPKVATLSNLCKNVAKRIEFVVQPCKQALTQLESAYGIYHELFLLRIYIQTINKPMYTVYRNPGLQSCLTGLPFSRLSMKNQKHTYINKLA